MLRGRAANRWDESNRELSSGGRRPRSRRVRKRSTPTRAELNVKATEPAINPVSTRPIEAHWKHQAERYGERIPSRELVESEPQRTMGRHLGRWFSTSAAFSIRLLWATLHLVLLVAAFLLLALIVLFVRYATVP